MTTEGEENSPNGRLKVTTYRNGKREVAILSEEQASELATSGFDLVVDRPHMQAVVRRNNGEILRHEGPLKGLGTNAWAFLLKLLRFPGRYLRPNEVGKLPPEIIAHYIKDNGIAYVARLRKHLFREEGRVAHFLLTTTPFAVAFNRVASYCLIERPETDVEDE